jgi:hypothetical protein
MPERSFMQSFAALVKTFARFLRGRYSHRRGGDKRFFGLLDDAFDLD